jgi:hypothetical protein
MAAPNRSFRPPRVPQPHRVRKIAGTFGWIDHRLLREGHLRALTSDDMGLYLFLVLAANRDGVSFYRKDKIADALGLSWDAVEQARRRLVARNLVAFETFGPGEVDGYYQVLPLA